MYVWTLSWGVRYEGGSQKTSDADTGPSGDEDSVVSGHPPTEVSPPVFRCPHPPLSRRKTSREDPVVSGTHGPGDFLGGVCGRVGPPSVI